MAELTIKIKPDDVVERVIDEVAYKGKTIREWAELLTNPNTNADRIRAMSNEELANWVAWVCYKAYSSWNPHYVQKPKEWLDWLQSPVGGEK